MRRAAKPGVDVAGGLLAVADGDRDRALGRNHVAAGEDPGVARSSCSARPRRRRRRPRAPARRRAARGRSPGRARARASRPRAPRARRSAAGSRSRRAPSARATSLPSSACLIGREPLHQHALLLGLLDLEVVRRHPVARAAVDDDRLLGAEPLRGAGGVHRGVARRRRRRRAGRAAAAPRPPCCGAARRRRAICAAVAGRDVRALADVRADREEGGVERALLHRVEDARHLAVRARASRRARRSGATSASRIVARQPVARDPEAHHPAGCGPGVADGDGVAEAGEVVGGREPGGPGADDEHPLPGGRRVDRRRVQPCAIASSPRNRSTELIPTASSSCARLQAVSHGW